MRFSRRAARAAPRLPDEQLRTTWQVCSLLVEYPTEELLSRVGLLRRATADLPESVGEPIGRVLDALESTPLAQLQSDYVETFDHTRRGCLYLTYFSTGDTRKRGVALVQLKQVYRRAGLEIGDAELPDHLAVVLEFGASGDAAAAYRILLDHRASLEVLRIALQERGSRWADVVLAVTRTLPPLEGDDAEAVRLLIEQGPPQEEVGLEPYAIDPRLNPRPDYLTPPDHAVQPDYLSAGADR